MDFYDDITKGKGSFNIAAKSRVQAMVDELNMMGGNNFAAGRKVFNAGKTKKRGGPFSNRYEFVEYEPSYVFDRTFKGAIKGLSEGRDYNGTEADSYRFDAVVSRAIRAQGGSINKVYVDNFNAGVYDYKAIYDGILNLFDPDKKSTAMEGYMMCQLSHLYLHDGNMRNPNFQAGLKFFNDNLAAQIKGPENRGDLTSGLLGEDPITRLGKINTTLREFYLRTSPGQKVVSDQELQDYQFPSFFGQTQDALMYLKSIFDLSYVQGRGGDTYDVAGNDDLLAQDVMGFIELPIDDLIKKELLQDLPRYLNDKGLDKLAIQKTKVLVDMAQGIRDMSNEQIAAIHKDSILNPRDQSDDTFMNFYFNEFQPSVIAYEAERRGISLAAEGELVYDGLYSIVEVDDHSELDGFLSRLQDLGEEFAKPGDQMDMEKLSQLCIKYHEFSNNHEVYDFVEGNIGAILGFSEEGASNFRDFMASSYDLYCCNETQLEEALQDYSDEQNPFMKDFVKTFVDKIGKREVGVQEPSAVDNASKAMKSAVAKMRALSALVNPVSQVKPDASLDLDSIKKGEVIEPDNSELANHNSRIEDAFSKVKLMTSAVAAFKAPLLARAGEEKENVSPEAKVEAVSSVKSGRTPLAVIQDQPGKKPEPNKKSSLNLATGLKIVDGVKNHQVSRI